MNTTKTAMDEIIALATEGRIDDALAMWNEHSAGFADDAEAWFLRCRIGVAQRQNDLALDAARRCVAINEGHLAGWLAVSDLAAPGNPVLSAGASLRAIRIAEQIDLRALPAHFRHELNAASLRVRRLLLDTLYAALDDVDAAFGPSASVRMRRGARMFAGAEPLEFAHPLLRPGLFYVPDLPPVMFFDTAAFCWASIAEDVFPEVRREYLELRGKGDPGFSPYVQHPDGSPAAETWRGVNNSKAWSTRHFYRHGERIDALHADCPATSAMLEAIDLQRIPGYAPECMFSVLQPKARIPAHHGSANGRVIVHLPLIVPRNCGAIRVGTETNAWVEGRLLAFDDAFRHEAWNDSDESRAVLIFDTWNPFLTEPERVALSAVLQAAQGFESQMLAASHP